MDHRTHDMPPLFYLIRCRDHYVLTDQEVSQEPSNLDSGPTLVGNVSHYDKQIDIAPLIGKSARLGAEEQYLIWVEPTDDAVDHLRDGRISIRHSACSLYHPLI